MNSLISFKQYLGDFIGTDVLKGPGLHLQKSSFVRLPGVADLFFFVLHGLLPIVGPAVLPAGVKSN